MEINADFSQPVIVHTDAIEWMPSPMPGVERRMLDRIGGEVARATSIVRYAKGSAFPEHTHSGGEEFIVLEGIFQDEHGDYPAGTYVRNPVGTQHIPRSDDGCTIFVKLWQFDPRDQDQFAIDLNTITLSPNPDRIGVMQAILADRDYETVSLESWEAGASAEYLSSGGLEALVLEGSLSCSGKALAGEALGRHDWVRFPDGASVHLRAGERGAKVWIKRGHLSDITAPAQVA